MRCLAVWAAAFWAWCAPLQAQRDDALEAFKDDVRAAVAAARGGRPRDLRAAAERLDAAQTRIDAVAEPRHRDLARLIVAVRRADLLFRAPEPRTDKARELVLAARESARAAGVWNGPYQETGLVLLWQAMAPAEFFALLAEADDDLALVDGRTACSAENALQLRLVRADWHLVSGREHEAIVEWSNVSAELRAAGSDADVVWLEKCHQTLLWYLLERREFARAEVYVPFLREADLRDHYAAMLANQRGDFVTTEALLARTDDPRSLLLLADAQEQLGEFDEAITTYERAMRHARTDAELRGAAQNGLGDCYRRRRADGDGARAEGCYRESLRLLQGLSSSRKIESEAAENHKDLGLLAEQSGDLQGAYACYGLALAQLEDARAGIPLDPFGASFLEPQFLGSIEGVLRTWRAAGATPHSTLATLDSAKARSLLDLVASPRALEDSPEVRAAVRALALARDAASVRRARLDLERARTTVAARAHIARPAPLPSEAIARLLEAEPDVVTFSYWLGDESAWLVAARAEEVRIEMLGSAAQANEMLRAAYGVVQEPPQRGDARTHVLGRDEENGAADWSPGGQATGKGALPSSDAWDVLDAAARFFLPPSAGALLAGARGVVFCPDDRVARLPFEALRWQGAPLGLVFDVERAPSLAVRERLRTRRPPPADALVLVVDSVRIPDGLAADFELDPLLFSGREGDLVAGAWPNATRLRGESATLIAMRESLSRAHTGLLHVSSHAVTSSIVPSASLLLLADGVTPLSSLSELPLEGATVVLSACATATGEQRRGEGDAALLWGPLGGGARCVVASSWAVNQQATCDLMGQMHHWIARGESVAAAVRRARKTLAAAPQYAHPHYWAGFAVYGERPGGDASGWLRWLWWPVWLAGGVLLLAVAGWRLLRRDTREATS